MIYLASPYSFTEQHPDWHSEQQKLDTERSHRLQMYLIAEAATARFIQAGIKMLSPIVHSHHVAMLSDLEFGFEFWREIDEDLINRSDGVVVLPEKGWEQSVGVQHEIMHAIRQGKPVWYCDPNMTELDFGRLVHQIKLDTRALNEIENQR